jgi:hypothetical protein
MRPATYHAATSHDQRRLAKYNEVLLTELAVGAGWVTASVIWLGGGLGRLWRVSAVSWEVRPGSAGTAWLAWSVRLGVFLSPMMRVLPDFNQVSAHRLVF